MIHHLRKEAVSGPQSNRRQTISHGTNIIMFLPKGKQLGGIIKGHLEKGISLRNRQRNATFCSQDDPLRGLYDYTK